MAGARADLIGPSARSRRLGATRARAKSGSQAAAISRAPSRSAPLVCSAAREVSLWCDLWPLAQVAGAARIGGRIARRRNFAGARTKTKRHASRAASERAARTDNGRASALVPAPSSTPARAERHSRRKRANKHTVCPQTAHCLNGPAPPAPALGRQSRSSLLAAAPLALLGPTLRLQAPDWRANFARRQRDWGPGNYNWRAQFAEQILGRAQPTILLAAGRPANMAYGSCGAHIALPAPAGQQPPGPRPCPWKPDNYRCVFARQFMRSPLIDCPALERAAGRPSRPPIRAAQSPAARSIIAHKFP